ncbi:MATE family efflux transporter [uncultured Rikenella sp.]|uniref:MATE family efflux transporter n=1 Tax=uncultured Rikenella sp. TaxID=368003 RepID=UPI0026024184|nr:MATE family efflux transporter [uncultured Rikenella sp.]
MITYTNRNIWHVAFPILLSLLMEHLIGLTDTAFLGRLGGHNGEIALGASSLGGVYYIAVFMLGFGFSVGAQILMARRNGEERYREIGPVFQQSALFLLFLATVVFAFSKFFAPQILDRLISSTEIYQATLEYLNWRIYGFFFIFLAVIFRAYYVAITRTKILTINSIVMVLSNVVLNYGLIFGRFGLPTMGIAGAAVASAVAELVSLLFFIVYTSKKIDWRKYGLFRRTRLNIKELGHILRLSSWTMVQQFVAVGTWFLFFVAVEHLGEQPLAVTTIVRSVSSLLFIIASSFATTSSSLVSNMMGAEQSRDVMSTVWRIIRMCYMLIVPLLAVILLFPRQVLRIYTDNPALIAASVPALLVMASAYLIQTSAFIWFNTVSGTGNTRAAFTLEMTAIATYALYVYFVVIHLRADVAWCWTTEHLYGVVVFALAYLYMRKADWQSKKI